MLRLEVALRAFHAFLYGDTKDDARRGLRGLPLLTGMVALMMCDGELRTRDESSGSLLFDCAGICYGCNDSLLVVRWYLYGDRLGCMAVDESKLMINHKT